MSYSTTFTAITLCVVFQSSIAWEPTQWIPISADSVNIDSSAWETHVLKGYLVYQRASVLQWVYEFGGDSQNWIEIKFTTRCIEHPIQQKIRCELLIPSLLLFDRTVTKQEFERMTAASVSCLRDGSACRIGNMEIQP